ncbi:hypothetical protein AD998_03270 [bacterium 336/3]|nr:hypothetical protein AD998_03270 [bacterium 336/3]
MLGFSSLDDTVSTEKKGLFFLPLIYYTPDTRWAFGGAGVYYFKIPPKDSLEKETRTSFVQFLADYTQNKQTDVWATWNIFTRNEDFLLKGDIRFRNFPDRFYGIGNNTSKENEERYAYNLMQIKAMFLKKIKHDFFIGFDYEFEKEYGFKYTTGGILESGSISGYKGGIGSALGFVAVIDTRDNIINAYKGSLAEVSSYFFTPILGSSFNFVNINGAYQKYWQIKPKNIIAFQTKAKFTFGDVPFLDMSTLGGEDILRGYPKNRFRDKNFIASQVEYRFPLVWRLGLTTFAGVGDIFNKASDLRFRTLKYSVGTGLRFVINPAERLNIRFDYAYGREGGQYYISVAEAF